MKIVIFGGHAYGISILEMAENITGNKVLGFLNDFEPVGSTIEDYPVLGNFTQWHMLPDDVFFVYPIHRVLTMYERYNKLKELNIPLERFASLIHPQATVSRYAKIGHGAIIEQNVTIKNMVEIGNFCTIKAGTFIGHDCRINDFTCAGANATLSGYAVTGVGSYIAPNAVLGINVSIGNFSTVGMGATLNKNIADFEIVQGNPAKVTGTYRIKEKKSFPKV